MQNVLGVPESPLLVLGGFVSEVGYPNLPAGAAAVATDCDFSVASVKTRDGIENVYTLEDGTPPDQFNYIKSFEQTDGETLTIALDANGVFWREDIESSEGVLAPFYSAIEPNTFAVSCTQDDREFIALSDLSQGTDMPRAYNGQWLDRVSQCGPAAAPSIQVTSTTYAIGSIVQPDAQTITGVQWNAGINSNSPGNVLTIYSPNSSFLSVLQVGSTTYPQVGSVVYLDFSNPKYSGINGTYLVTAVGQAYGMESGGGTLFYYISVQAPSVAFGRDFDNSSGEGTVQLTIATLTATTPLPDITVGTQITVSDETPSNWNGTWTITGLENGAVLQITSDSLSSQTATYNYTLLSGVAPVPGQLVTITGCTNAPIVGSGAAAQSIFNQYQAVIASATSSTFTIAPIGSSGQTGGGPETNAFAQVLPTEITFDPGLGLVGSDTDPIFGNGGSGSLITVGQLGAGLRQCVMMFLTRNGYLTEPSPPVTFSVPEGASLITATNLLIGPPNVVARVLAFTGANGDFFYWIPTASQAISDSQVISYSSTVVNDNTLTQTQPLRFTDALLLAASSIDAQGSNNFAQIELGACTGFTAYADRLFAIGENNKVQNFNNLSFNGGYLSTAGTSPTLPAGWVPDPTFGGGGSLVVSALFGDAYQIQNVSGVTQSPYGMITQSASLDSNNVPIIEIQTEYSIRITASVAAPVGSGTLTVDLYSPSFGTSFGAFNLSLTGLSTTARIATGTLLTTAFQTSVPPDLQLRLYAAMPNNATAIVDRIEVFDAEQPVLSTQLRASYENNFEAFDGVTGNLGVGSQNQQPVINSFELFDNLYIVKSKSMFSTVDNGTTEPNLWNVRTVSNKCGTPSIHGVDYGEGWAIIVSQAGAYIFVGGEPVKFSPELDGNPGLWQSINWQYGNTIWTRNDTEQRKLYIGVPIPTPNQWMPRFPKNSNPAKPNVVLMMNYKELMRGADVQNMGPLRLSYMGDLKSWAIGRKWSAWSIEACYADFIDRADSSSPLFLCADDGTGRINQQITGQYNDNGEALICEYITYGFPKAQDAQQQGMGLHELLCEYLTMTIVGSGDLNVIVYPDSVDSPYAEALYPHELSNPAPYGDMELPVNEVGSRFFFGLSVKNADEWFEVSKIIPAMAQNPWAPCRGSNES